MKRPKKILCLLNTINISTLKNPQLLPIGNIPAQPKTLDAFKLLENAIKSIPNMVNRTKYLHGNVVPDFFIDYRTITVDANKRTISGELYTGSTGIDSEIIDVRKNSSYNRKTSDVELLPLNFIIEAPKNKYHIVVATHTLGQYSVTSKITNYLLRKLRASLLSHGYHADLKTIIMDNPKMKKFIQDGEIKKIEITRFESTQNVSSTKTSNINASLSLSPVNRTALPFASVTRFLINKDKTGLVSQINSLIGVNFTDCEKIKCSIKLDKQERVIDILDPEANALKYNLSNLPRKKESCQPERTEILKSMIDIIIDSRRTIS